MATTLLYNSGTTSQPSPLVGTERVLMDGGGALISEGTTSQIAAAPLPVSSPLTAHAGGGQTLAKLLSVGFNKVTVVATTNDSVQLPASQTGREVTVVNATATQMAIYGNAVDNAQINQYGAGNPYYLPGGNVATFVCTDTGDWFTTSQFSTVAAGAVLSATGAGFSNALGLVTDINTIGSAISGAGVLLPPELSAPAGSQITIINQSVNTITVYSADSTIDATTGTTGVTLTAAHRGAIFYKNAALKWISALFGAVSS